MVRLHVLLTAAVAALLAGCTTGFEVTQERFEEKVRTAFGDLRENLKLEEGEVIDRVCVAGSIDRSSLDSLDKVARGPCNDFFNESRRTDLEMILKDCLQKGKAFSLGASELLRPTCTKLKLQFPEDLYTPAGQEQLAKEFRRLGNLAPRLLLAKVNITHGKDPQNPSDGEKGLTYTVQLDLYDLEETQNLAVGTRNDWVSLPRRTIFGQVWDFFSNIFGKATVNGRPIES